MEGAPPGEPAKGASAVNVPRIFTFENLPENAGRGKVGVHQPRRKGGKPKILGKVNETPQKHWMSHLNQ